MDTGVYDPLLTPAPAPASPAPASPATATPAPAGTAPAGAGPAAPAAVPEVIPTVNVHARGAGVPLQATPQPTPGLGAGAPTVTAPAPAAPPQPLAKPYDPLAGVAPAPAIPPEVQGQEMRNQPWYQAINDYVSGVTGSLSHGATFGLDEIVAPLMPAIVESLRTGKPFSEAYDNQVATMRQPRTNFEDQNPIASNALELAGNVATGGVFKPLFAPERTGAVTAAQKALDYARNVVAGTGVAGATSFTSAPGDLADRAEAAKQGMEFGGPLAAAAPVIGRVAANTARSVARAAAPNTQIPNIVGKAVSEDYGGGLPFPSTAPIPSVDLNLPQATNSPQAARTLDTLNAVDNAGMQEQRSAQNQQMLNALKGRVPGEPRIHTETQPGMAPEEVAARGSRAATKAVKDAAQISRTEEERVWNKPPLSVKKISTATTKNAVDRELSAMRREEPGLGMAFDDSPQLQRAVRGLKLMPQKAPANELNKVSSLLRAIARDPKYDGDVRHIATRLANKVQDGMMEAPEVRGQAPMTQAELDAMNHPAAPPIKQTQVPSASHVIGGAPARPVDAVTSIIDKGGLKDPKGELSGRDPDKDRHRFRGQFLGKVINKDTGMTPNEARNFLRDNGYLSTDEANDEGIAAKLVEEHLAGNPRYRASDAAEAEYWRQHDEAAGAEADRMANARAEIQHVADQHGIRVSQEELDHAAQLRLDDPHMHPEEALIHATNASHEQIANWNAQRNAFGPAGMPPGATADQLPDMEQLRNGVKADPEIRRDLEAARAFTKREAEVFGHASFDNILNRNSRGNETVTPGTALSKFFDFANGVERPGDIKNVSRFLDDIRSEWLKLSAEDQAGTFNPGTIAPVQRQLEEGAQNYIMGKLLDAISSQERDMSGSRMLQYRQAMHWIDTNRDMLERTGLFSHDQLDLIDRFRDTAEMLQRDKDLARGTGSPTVARAFHAQRFVDLFTGPLTGRFMGAGIGAAVGGLLTSWLGEAAIGIIIGAELGGVLTGQQVLRSLYTVPRENLLRAFGEAYRNPRIAHDLAQKVSAAGTTRPSADTVNWIRGLVASGAGETVGRYNPAQHPAMAQ